MKSGIVTCFFLLLLLAPRLRAQQGTESEERDAEDPRRVQLVWSESLPPVEYMRAAESTGMLSVKQWERNQPAGPLDWTPIGPIGSVSRYNGRISGIHVRQQNSSQYVYAGGCSGGLWRALASDGNGVWTSLGDGLPNPSVRAFAVHPSNPDDILVGTGDYTRYKGAGMFHTTNAGATWTQVPLPAAPTEFYRIIYLPGNPSVVIAACSSGIMRSSDGGATWTTRLSGQATDLILHPSIPNIQYTSVIGSGVFRSLDGGVQWSLLSSITTPFGRASMAICRDSPTNIALVVENGSNALQGVFSTVNGGADWSNITSNLTGFGGFQVEHAQAITYRPNNPDEIYVGSIQIARTDNGGSSWQVGGDNGIDIGHSDITQLYFSTTTGDDVLWICNDGGIYRHTIGGSTQDWDGDGVTGLRCSQIDFMDSRRAIRSIGLQDNGVMRSVNGGGSWLQVSSGDGAGCSITDDISSVFWYSVNSGNGDNSVWRVTLTDPPQQIGNTDVTQYEHWCDLSSGKVYSATSTNLVSANSSDATPSWAVETSLPITDIHLVYGDPLDGRTVYVTCETQPKLIILRKNGTAWTSSIYDFGGDGQTRFVYVSKEIQGEAWIGLRRVSANASKLYHTTDFGQTWTDISGTALRSVGYVKTLVAKPFNRNELFVGTDLGVFHTVDGGASWQPYQNGLPIVQCTDLRYIVDPAHSGNDLLLLSTFGRGMYQKVIPTSPISYVDRNATGSGDGTFEHPYQSYVTAVALTPPGGTIALRANNYPASPLPLVIGSRFSFESYAGPSTLGVISGAASARASGR